MKPAVLLWMMGMRGVEDVAEGLLEACDIELLSLDPSTAALSKRGIPHRSLWDFLPAEAKTRSLDTHGSYKDEIQRRLAEPALRAAYPDVEDATWITLMARLDRVLDDNLLMVLLMTDLVRNAAAQTDLRMIVVSEDVMRDTRTVVETATRLGIPSLQVVHGVPCGAPTTHLAHTATYVAAYSEHVKQIYASFGIDPARIFVTGNPGWDRFSRPPRSRMNNEVRTYMGLEPDRPVVTYAMTNSTSWSTETLTHPQHHIQNAEAVVDAFGDLARRHPNWQFMLRPRPGDVSAPVQRLMKRAEAAGIKRLVNDQLPVYESLVITDVMVCTQSNIGLEALLLGKPVVNVDIAEFSGNLYEEGLGPLFTADDAVLHVREIEALAPAIEHAVSDDATRTRLRAARETTVAKYNHSHDGKATERVVRLILELMNQPLPTTFVRHPEFEPALFALAQTGIKPVACVGKNAQLLAALADFTMECPGGAHDWSGNRYATMLLADPLPSNEAGHVMLGEARIIADMIVFFCRCPDEADRNAHCAGNTAPPRPGAEPPFFAGQYSREGVEVLLARCGLVADAWETVFSPASARSDGVIGWAVSAVPKAT